MDGVGLFLEPSQHNRGFMAPRVILTGQHKWHVRQRNALLQEFSPKTFWDDFQLCTFTRYLFIFSACKTDF